MSKIKCGNCKATHDTAAQVRQCYGNSGQLPEANLPEVSARPAPSQRAVPQNDEELEGMLSYLHTQEENSFAYSLILFYGRYGYLTVKQRNAVKRMQSSISHELEDGVYFYDGSFFKVQRAVTTTGQQYAKRLHVTPKGEKFELVWEYEGRRPLHDLRPEHRVTAERAREFGLLYGVCINCGRTLTREESLHVGYGPTCAENNGWAYPTKAELAEATKRDAAPTE